MRNKGKKMKSIKLLLVVLLGVYFSGCATKPKYVENKQSATQSLTLGIDDADFQNASIKLINSILQSGTLQKSDGSKSVLAISRIINDTTQTIDMDQLVKKIRIALLRSGKVIVTTAVAAGGAEDELNMETRKLRDNDEFKQSTIAKKGTLIAPDLSLSGKIIQRTSKIEDDEVRIDYYFQMTLTQLKTGLAVWEDEVVIRKEGEAKSVTW